MRIAVSGAHRTGKTTLVEQLARLLPDHAVVDEPYRLLEEEGYEFSAMPSLDDFERQLDRSVATLLDAAPNQILDRCPADLLAYLICHEDAEAFDPASGLSRVAEAMAAIDLVVFVPIERPDRIAAFDDDYTALRRRVDGALRQMIVLDQWGFGCDFVEVEGPVRRRVRRILGAIGVDDRTASRGRGLRGAQ